MVREIEKGHAGDRDLHRCEAARRGQAQKQHQSRHDGHGAGMVQPEFLLHRHDEGGAS